MALSRQQLSVGTSREAVVVDDLTRTQLVMYAGASGDYNPLHTDELFATKVAGFPGVFAHGMLTMALTGKALTDWVGDGRLRTFGVRFRGQVWPGDTLTTTVTVRALDEADGEPVADLDVVTANQAGDVVLSGTASARLDP
jgi:acyl dehydratase